MRVVFAPVGSRGDIHPLLAIAERLIATGHSVLFTGPPEFAPVAKAKGVAFQPVGRAWNTLLEERAAKLCGGTRKSLTALNDTMLESLEAQFNTLPDLLRGADLVVGASVQLAASSLCEKFGIPYRFVVYCPSLIPSPGHLPMLFPTTKVPRTLYPLAWKLVRRGYNKFLRKELNRWRQKIGLGPIGDTVDHVLTSRPLLACDAELAPAPPYCSPAPVQVGYLQPSDESPLPPELDAFLAAGPAPVYVGFGSMTDTDGQATTRAIIDGIRGLGARGLIYRGSAKLAQEELPDGFLAIDDVNHAKLFPRVAAVVHHGGAGTTATAARAGVPQLAVPHLTEQLYWGACMVRFGVGARPFTREKLSAARLQKALGGMLGNEVMASRAAELGERLRRTDPIGNALAALGVPPGDASRAGVRAALQGAA